MSDDVGGALREGLEAFDRHAWRQAFEQLQEAGAAEPLEPEHLERLAEAAWWTGRLQACVGLHRAEAVRRAGDYDGLGVHAAARIAALAGGEEVLASEEVAAAGGRHALTPAREMELRGVREPVRVVSVEWR